MGADARSARLAAAIALVVAAGPIVPTAQQPHQQPPPSEGAGQAQEAQPQPPVFRTGINFVRVDAIVTDRQGNPVTDLTVDDFEVFEDGKPQTIESFRFVRIEASVAPATSPRPIITRADEERAAGAEDARIFVFFLDDYHVRLGNSMAARKPLADFVRTALGPQDLVAVMYPLTPLEAVTLTRDHDAVIRALESFEGRKYNYEPRNAIEQRYSLYPAEVVERIRRQVSLSALEGLAIKLGALREGRKAVIVVSEGYTAVLPPQLRDPIASMPGVGNPARRQPMLGENSPIEERAEFVGQLDVQQELQRVFSAANRSNSALYTVDPRGLAAGEFDISENVGIQRSAASLRQTQDTLRVLADQTDGRAFVNRNDFGRAMLQIVKDSSAYYLLGYNSTEAPQDGRFHEIRVRVKRSGVQVRARKGYWALTEDDVARVIEEKPSAPPEVSRALSTISTPERDRFVRTWVGTSRADDGRTLVTFVWEPIPAPPGVRRDEPTAVSVTAASPAGETYFEGVVSGAPAAGHGEAATPDAGTGARAPAAAGSGDNLARQATFVAPPGRLQLRIGVNGSGGPLDVADREVVVPDLSAPALALATPRVYAVRTARDFQQLRRNPAAPPTASRDFRRTQRLVVRFEAYAPGDAPITVAARLLNRQGNKLVDVPVASRPGEPFLVDLPLAALAPSEYLLELTASVDGHEPVRELVAFRVEG